MLDRRGFIMFLAGLGFISVGGTSHSAYEKGMGPRNGGRDMAISSIDNHKGSQSLTAVIKVVGVGGCGCNAVNSMIASGVMGAEFVAVDTDKHSLSLSKAESNLLIGTNVTRGLGARANLLFGRSAAYESSQCIRQMLSGAHIVFIVAGMGGRTGSGSVPVIARIAQENGALCVAVVTRPFDSEKIARKQRAEKCISELSNVVDSYVVLQNQTILSLIMNEQKKPPIDSFRESDRFISRSIVPILDAVQVPGHLNIEIEDLRSILFGAGRAYSGTGEGIGPSRAVNAARNALLELEQFGYLKGSARKVLVNIITGPDSGIAELDEVLDDVKKSMASEAQIRFAAVVKENLHNRIRVSVLAAACDHEHMKRNVENVNRLKAC